MVALVSLAYAKEHLRRTDEAADADISIKIEQASAIVLDYLKCSTVPGEWLIGSPYVVEAPANIQAATLLILGELFMNREASVVNVLSPAIENLLHRMPTLA